MHSLCITRVKYINAHFDSSNFSQNQINYDFWNGINDSMDTSHSMHLLNQNQNIIIYCSGDNDLSTGEQKTNLSTWRIKGEVVEKSSKKNDIYQQIGSGLGFL